MNKNVIHLFGGAGSGTTTLGRYIAGKMNWYFMDTDDYYWQPVDPPYSVKRAIPERLEMIRRDIETHDNVVLSGALSGWGNELIELFTLAIRVETDQDIRIARLKERERRNFGSRIDIGGDMYRIHQDFIAWACRYDTAGPEIRSKARHDLWQKKLNCPLVCVDGALLLEDNWEIIRHYIQCD